MIPLYHDFSAARVLIFGGGPVGARKARRFAGEADVIVCSPTFTADSFGDAECVRASPTPADVPDWLDRADPRLVVTATDDPALNDAIEAAADEREVLVNRADESGPPTDGGVIVPATVTDDPVAVAVSTGGASPALAAELRDRIATAIDGAGELATVTADLRTELRTLDVEPETRRAAMRAVVGDAGVWTALDTPGSNVRDIAADVITDVTGDST